MIMIMSDQIKAVFASVFASGRPQALEPGQTLFRTDDPVRRMYLVQAGSVDLVRHTPNGTRLLLTRVQAVQVLAEASAYSPRYHCDAVVNTAASLQSLPVSEFREAVHDDPETARLWAMLLARQLQAARMLSEIRSLKTVAERLDAWLSDNHTLPPKGQIQTLAHLLSVSREALYREIARRGGPDGLRRSARSGADRP